MINVDGKLLESGVPFLDHQNRGLRYGDALFETLRIYKGQVLFWENHYLRLMASMRILRMEIPMEFTMEYLEGQIQNTLNANALSDSARVRLTVYRRNGGRYTPSDKGVSWIIETENQDSELYPLVNTPLEVELFKDHYLVPGLLSTLKTNNKLPQVLAGIFAEENAYGNCLLLNTDKNLVEALNGNVFLVQGQNIITPPLQDGCLNGVFRKQLMAFLQKHSQYNFEERSVSPFELQKSDELWITNVISGIQPVSRYRKRDYAKKVAEQVLQEFRTALAETQGLN